MFLNRPGSEALKSDCLGVIPSHRGWWRMDGRVGVGRIEHAAGRRAMGVTSQSPSPYSVQCLCKSINSSGKRLSCMAILKCRHEKFISSSGNSEVPIVCLGKDGTYLREWSTQNKLLNSSQSQRPNFVFYCLSLQIGIIYRNREHYHAYNIIRNRA